MARRPARDPHRRDDIEQNLANNGVAYYYEEQVALDAIDFEASLNNQARIFKTLDEATVEVYAEALRRGDVFPAVVLYHSARGKFIAADGNHRMMAYKVLETPVQGAYILDAHTDPRVITKLTFEANAKHGLPNTIEERAKHAVQLLELGASQGAVAANLNIPEASVRREWAKYQANNRAAKHKIPDRVWDALNPSVQMRLNTISTDEGFTSLTRLAHDARLSVGEVDKYVTEMNKQRSSKNQSDFVTQQRLLLANRVQEVGGGTFKSSRRQGPRNHLSIALGHFKTLEKDVEALVSTLMPTERDSMVMNLEWLAEFALDLAKKIETAPAGTLKGRARGVRVGAQPKKS